MKNKIFFSIFIILWALLVIFNLIAPKETFSEAENRNLATWPKFTWEKLVDGTYAKQMEEYINDHFIFRKEWVALKTISERSIGKTEINNVYIGKDGYLFEKVDSTLENMNQAVENIDSLARKTANTNILHDSAELNLYKSRQVA